MVTLENTGSVALALSDISATGKDFSQTKTCGASLGPKDTRTMTVTFKPTKRGARGGHYRRHAVDATEGNADGNRRLVVVRSTPPAGPSRATGRTLVADGPGAARAQCGNSTITLAWPPGLRSAWNISGTWSMPITSVTIGRGSILPVASALMVSWNSASL